MERTIKIVAIVAVVLCIGFFGYKKISNWYDNKVENVLEKEREQWQKKTVTLENKIINQQEEIDLQKETITPTEKLNKVFGEDLTGSFSSPEEKTCDEIKQPVKAFFSYLDNKEYILAHNAKPDTFKRFTQTVALLSENLPMVTEETKDLLSLLHNVAHFYRVLGKERVRLAKDVLKNESEITESMMETFFTWFMSAQKCPDQTPPPSLDVLYEYAGFFLNTLAGRSYLLRRDAKLRILTVYYCVMIIDQANDQKINANGIDLRPHIDASYNDIYNQKRLVNQKQYLMALDNLKAKYGV